MLDMSLTFHQHFESLCKKLTLGVTLLRRLAGCGAGATTLQIATLALVHATAEYCAPVWCCSAYTFLINPTINNCDWMPVPYTSGQASNPRMASNLLNFVAMEPHRL